MFITSKISQGLSQAFNQTKVLDATFIVWNGFYHVSYVYPVLIHTTVLRFRAMNTRYC